MKTIDINTVGRREYYASDNLIEELRNKTAAIDKIINFAYTDYGGSFYDKVCITYFSENYPDNIVKENTSWNGENALLFGLVAEQFAEDTENYPLPGNLEEYYFEMAREQNREDFEYFVDDLTRDYEFDRETVLDWITENKEGYYQIVYTQTDFSYSDLVQELEENNLINKIQ